MCHKRRKKIFFYILLNKQKTIITQLQSKAKNDDNKYEGVGGNISYSTLQPIDIGSVNQNN
jgi:hypothetical protein